MGAIVSFMGDLPVWYWFVAFAVTCVLLMFLVADEIDDQTRYLENVIYDQLVRILVKLIMLAAVAVFWAFVLSVTAFMVALYIIAGIGSWIYDLALSRGQRVVPSEPASKGESPIKAVG